MPAPTLLWFRHDLRLADHPALTEAAQGPVLPVFVLDDAAAGNWAYGGAARWWLRQSLASLAISLAERGAELLLLRGSAAELLPRLAAATGAGAVHASAVHEPWAMRQAEAVAAALATDRRSLRLHAGALLHDPATLRSGSGTPYGIYTPFARALGARGNPPAPLPAPERLHAVVAPERGLPIEGLGLYPVRGEPNWASEFGTLWRPGEAGAAARLRRFLDGPVRGYKQGRNDPGVEGSSGLSPHLRWGEISPATAWHATLDALDGDREAAQPFLAELIWRDFSYHLLTHRSEMPERALRQRFEGFPFAPDADLLRAWQRGRTGYPIVDAGMRQLWRLGWMHNRVRMIAASLLVKHLLQPWQDGARWFWDTLVDADLANNSASWQWVAGAGTDAAPYFRVFNPVLQGEKFDPTGRYVRRFVPELAALPDRWLHQPWSAPADVLRDAGVVLGETYPRPVIDHATGRRRALDALAALRPAPADAIE